jgi:hypothetical protein
MKTVVVLKMSNLSVVQKLDKAKFIVQSMTNNPRFTAPIPSLAEVNTFINELETAHLNALDGGKQKLAIAKEKAFNLTCALNMLASYVESISDQSEVTEAASIVLSSGMDVKSSSFRTSPDFQVERTDFSGEVKISTKSDQRAIFQFQMTLTPDDESSYQTIGMSTRARMVQGGLKVGQTYSFRVQTIGKAGPEGWSRVIDFLVT